MLTPKQHELLLYVQRRLAETGVSPSFDEMREALDLRSKSGIHRLITGLEERGFIRRLPHRARALEILRLPEAAATPQMAAAPAPVADLGAATPVPLMRSPVATAFMARQPANQVSLPLYGRIAAGLPIEATRDTATIDIPTHLVESKGDHYALEVAGDSMIEAGILDGDITIIKRCDTAENGAIIVALVDDQEVTLKRLRRKGASIALEPANKAYETRIFGPDRVRIQGKLVGLLRRY